MFHVKQLLFARIAEPITWLVVAAFGVKRSKQTGCVAIKVRPRELPSLWRAAAVIACKKDGKRVERAEITYRSGIWRHDPSAQKRTKTARCFEML